MGPACYSEHDRFAPAGFWASHNAFLHEEHFSFQSVLSSTRKKREGEYSSLTQALLASTVKPDGILSTQLTDQLVSSATPTLTFIYC